MDTPIWTSPRTNAPKVFFMTKKDNKSIKVVLPPLKKILIIGGGGRENSLAWALSKSPEVLKVYVAPGNGGTEDHSNCYKLNIDDTNSDELINACKSLEIDLVIIGPEKPLAAGLADVLRQANLVVFGPGKQGAQLEASKQWAKKLMVEANIPTAKHWTATSEKDALQILNAIQTPLVVKADGLASGKGVTVCNSLTETKAAIKEAFTGKFGEAGTKLVLEEILKGPEVSIFAICDGKNLRILPPAQDHKRLLDNDEGPNTGGMGAYAPTPILTKKQLQMIEEEIMLPTLKALIKKEIDFRGVIYAGLMLTDEGPKVIEYNCRFGDPECQALMPLMGPELAKVLQSAALGALEIGPKLLPKDILSVCVIAASSGYPDNPRKGDKISINLEEKEGLPIQLFHSGTTINQEGELITSGGRILSIVAQGTNYQNAFKTAYMALKKIDFKGIYYRCDIGYQVRNNEPSFE